MCEKKIVARLTKVGQRILELDRQAGEFKEDGDNTSYEDCKGQRIELERKTLGWRFFDEEKAEQAVLNDLRGKMLRFENQKIEYENLISRLLDVTCRNNEE